MCLCMNPKIGSRTSIDPPIFNSTMENKYKIHVTSTGLGILRSNLSWIQSILSLYPFQQPRSPVPRTRDNPKPPSFKSSQNHLQQQRPTNEEAAGTVSRQTPTTSPNPQNLIPNLYPSIVVSQKRFLNGL